MLPVDTNILLSAVETRNAAHAIAAQFLNELHGRDDVVLSELVLLELYVLLRNPAVLVRPLSALVATNVVQAFRRQPERVSGGERREVRVGFVVMFRLQARQRRLERVPELLGHVRRDRKSCLDVRIVRVSTMPRSVSTASARSPASI